MIGRFKFLRRATPYLSVALAGVGVLGGQCSASANVRQAAFRAAGA